MSAGFHRLGTNVVRKLTGYHANSLPVGVLIAGAPVLQVETPKSTSPKLSATLIEGEIAASPRKLNRQEARLSGYTGDACTYCQSMQVKRNGSCLVCEACGQTTGCS